LKGGEYMNKFISKAYRLAYLAPLAMAAPASVAGQSIDFPTNFAGFTSQDIKVTIGNIVRIIVGFLGIITIIIILAGGLKWMTSAGNEDKIAEAKKLISAGVIGLVIVLAAYAIANFVIASLVEAL
jgi:hypothetical protein